MIPDLSSQVASVRDEPPATHAAGTSRVRLGDLLRRARRPWVWAFVLLALAVLTRAGELNGVWRRNMIDVALLRQVMSAISGDPLPAAADFAAASGEAAPDGLRARALARIDLQAGRPDEAERSLKEALAVEDTSELTRFELCRFYAAQGRIGEAKHICRDARPTAPFWLSQGIIAVDNGHPEDALAYFDLARSADPNMLPAWERLAQAMLDLGRLEEALPVLEHLLYVQARPPALTFRQLGDAFQGLGRASRARATLEEGLTHYPDDRELYLALANSFRQAGDADAADQWLEQLLHWRPQDAYAWALRGELALARDDHAAAEAHYRRASEIEPQASSYWFGLAQAAMRGGDEQAARMALNRVLALEPGHPEATRLLSRLEATAAP